MAFIFIGCPSPKMKIAWAERGAPNDGGATCHQVLFSREDTAPMAASIAGHTQAR
jgi:hypothetical protein